ncbi:aspartate dehydrogenase [Kerstersia gyiorum]|uniref:L-aspartate dehydrogenase n=1 Tax=Kerstersia gyiorum TaxID=206506 RepID=A0A4Q7MJ15_9BURK|nr:aspartate dehydrogenase [Kerstersia gyiorum]KAB0543065.1 aspartate dehydrogenase [Kerstersia gyiorum]RZS67563.1 aspartate dehydrogenase [Kerstersia gyiorum]
MTYRIAFIGMGTIAQDVARTLLRGERGAGFELGALSRSQPPGGELDILTCFAGLESLLAWRPDLVIEAASQQAVWELVPACLRTGIPVLVTSVGALADTEKFLALQQAAAQGGVALRVPAGAVASLDYLQALRGVEGVKVVYESRKPVDAWLDELALRGVAPDALQEPLELFRGNARDAALRYPKNLNVAATVALACTGMEATEVSVVVDPAATGNTHTICVNSPMGELRTTLKNEPSPTNPKTSWVVAQSIVSAVERQFASFVVA